MSFLYDQKGNRKYLTIDERTAFLNAASLLEPEIHTFCLMLAYTGARISEVLALTPERFDFAEKTVVFECLKKRRKGIYRTLPLPSEMLERIDDVQNIREAQRNQNTAQRRIWTWGRTTAWKRVKKVMANANIIGARACPKGLRHSFGVCGLQKNVPLNMMSKWLGHARLSTTAIYGDAVGDEERKIASRMWT